MSALQFQNPKKAYTVNDGAEIHFNPADVAFVNRLFELMDKIKAAMNLPRPEKEDVFATAARRNAEVRALIDEAFEEPVCDKVFGSADIFSPCGGMPLCMNFLMAVIDEVDAAAEKETKVSPTMQEYMHKYEAKYGRAVK